MNLSLKATLIGIITLNQLSCMKPPTFEDGDGSPVSPEQVQESLLNAWANSDPFTIQNQEFHLQEKTIQISSLPAQRVMQRGITVTKVDVLERDKSGNPTQKKLHLGIQVEEMLDNNQSKLSTRERTVSVSAIPETTLNALSLTAVESKKLFLENLKEINQGQKTQKVQMMADESEISQITFELFLGILRVCSFENFSCFNLKSWDSQEEAPDLIKQKPGCEGLAGCKINYKNIQFDVVFTEHDDSTHTTTKSKVIYNIKISLDAPFLSKLMGFCYMGMAASNNQKFPVQICYKTVNFNRGSP